MSTQKLTLMQQLDLDHIHSVIVHHRAIVFAEVPIITVADHQSRLNSTHGRFLQHGEHDPFASESHCRSSSMKRGVPWVRKMQRIPVARCHHWHRTVGVEIRCGALVSRRHERRTWFLGNRQHWPCSNSGRLSRWWRWVWVWARCRRHADGGLTEKGRDLLKN